jgi:class 3 adenylate cyclase/tetratricopeptide (TPR) repeat protein
MITCPVCATDCPTHSRFCLACGTPLDASRARFTERRVVTVLFADLVGFTSLSERLDPEDVDRLLREYCLLARSAIEVYGGSVEKYIGDAVAGVFGVPRLHEDDAERAVRAGLRLLDRLPALADLTPDGDVQARVGINTGSAFVRLDVLPGSGQGFVVGDAVNTAARLQQHGEPMRVVVGELTHDLVADTFDCETMAPLAAKGKSVTLRPWVVTGPRSRSGIDVRREFASPFVGREVELGMLKGLFEKACVEREPQSVLLTGEAGIGKSRLVLELARHLDDEPDQLVTWRQGRALPHGDKATFWSLAEIVRQHAGVLENDDPPTVERKLSRTVTDVEDAAWILQRVRPLLGLESPSAPAGENFAAWRRFLETMVGQGPAVVVFDDMHWAQPGELAFLDDLLTHLSDVPILLLVVARPELRDEHPDVAAGGPWVHLELHPLSAYETRRFVGFLAGAAATEIEPAVAERCGGNPFFTEELVRLLRERSSLPGDAEAWRQEAAATALPSSLAALVAARLDALDPDLKDLLSDASVVGKTFWPGALAAAGGTDQAAVDRRLRELARREFILPVPASSLAGEAEYAFWHGLTREVAYAALPRGVRATKHAAVAQWIEGGELRAAASGTLAHHYESALELGEAAGNVELVGRLTGPAIHALRAAGDRALPLDVIAAERHYRRAIGLCREGSPLMPGLLIAHGESLLERGDLAEARSALERGLLGLRESGEVRAEAVATDRLASTLWLQGDARAVEVAARAAALLEDVPPSAEQVKVIADWAAICAASYESETAIAAADRALGLCRKLRLPVSVRALGWRGLARSHFGDAGGLDDLRRALRLAKRQGLGRYGGMLYSNLSDETLTHRGPTAAWRLRREGIAFTRGRGDRLSMLGLQAEEVEDLCCMGRWDAALALAGEIETPLATAGQILDLVCVHSTVARIRTARGQAATPKVRAFVEWTRGREFPDQSNSIDVLDALACVHDSLGERDTALLLLRRIAEAREAISSCPHYGLVLPAEVRMAVELGDLGLARRIAAKTVASRALDGHTLVLFSALESEQEGEYDRAAQRFAEAASRWYAFGAPYEAAQARLGQGRCLVALGRADDAARPLRGAARVFRRLGAAPALSQTFLLTKSSPAARSRGARG